MDDKTFMAKYVADEMTRMKNMVKGMVECDAPPPEEEKEQMMQDMVTSIGRLKQVLAQMQQMVDAEEIEEEKEPEPQA